MRKLFTLFFILLSWYIAAQIPSGYYNTAEGKTGADLKTALFNIVSSHTALSYAALWTAFKTTDVRADGLVWDIYSNTTNFVFGSADQCGDYKKEGDCYNREHSFPKSWFNDATPMYTDLFHLYPSDGYVNNRRSNYPFGEVSSPTYTSNNSYTKLGNCSYPGYTDVVFEPADELKGDMARTYFYMVTAYEDKVTGWSCPHLDGTKYPALTSWTISMFLKWSTNDPVGAKETNRNNVIYSSFQHNRNPFIDHPELADYIWGAKKGLAWSSSVGAGVDDVVLNDLKIIVLKDDHTITLQTDDGRQLGYSVFDVSGKILLSGAVNAGRSVGIGALGAGIYLIRVSDGTAVRTEKFVL
jgi:endonuclease I